jgi:hypothetical protein
MRVNLTKSLTVAVLLLAAGCGKKSTKDVMIGSWELDKPATEKTNPLIAALPKGMRYDFNGDGTAAVGISGPPRKATWKVAKEAGGTLTVEVLNEGDKEPTVVELTAVDADHLTLNFPKGLGACQLKRRPAGAKDEVVEVKPDDPADLAALKKTKAELIDAVPEGTVINVSFPFGTKRDEVLPALPHLKGLPGLRLVGLGYCGLTDADLATLKDLKQVANFLLNNNQITDAGLEHLAGLTAARDLFLSDNRGITDKGLAHLKGLTGLRLLSLEGTQVTDAGLENLKGMTDLQTLKLWATAVKGPGLVHLHGLPKLENLYADADLLKQATPEQLKGLSHLQIIYAAGGATPEVAQKVKAAIPGCEVK